MDRSEPPKRRKRRRRNQNRNNREQVAYSAYRNPSRGLQNQNSRAQVQSPPGPSNPNNTNEKKCNNNYGIPTDLYERFEIGTSNELIPQHKHYPITSRGLGFLINIYFHEFGKLFESLKNFDENIIHVIYRVTLLQLEAQLSQSQFVYRPCEERDYVPKQNFYLIASVLGIIGNFTEEIEDNIYIEYSPKMKDNEPDGNGEIIYNENNPPDPYTVSLRNLRNIVEFLSDPNPDYLNLRKYFYENNPIPNTKWDNYVLLNADDIIPPEYNMRADFRKFNDFMYEVEYNSRFRLRRFSVIGSCLLDGSGDFPALVSVEPVEGMALHGNARSQTLENFTTPLRCIVTLTGGPLLIGFVGLVGERPPYSDADDIWCIRSPFVSCIKSTSQNWVQVVDFLMQK